MTYLLDTCIVSKLRKLSSRPDTKLESWISSHPETDYFISAITIGEIQSGISKLNVEKKAEQKKKMIFEEWLFGELIPRFGSRILNIDTAIMIKWGHINGACKRNGYNLPLADSLIAATALFHNLIVVTENSKDFEKSGAEILNPWML